jgi:ribosomal RNA-processing protein 8
MSSKKQVKKRKYDEERGTHFFDTNVFKKRKLQEVPKTKGGFGKSTSNLTELQHIFKKKLEGAKFRYLNEKLYTCTGAEAREMFEKEPNLFKEYHDGYRQAVEEWPYDPVKSIINFLSKQPKTKVVADFGCGEARIAQAARQKVHSFDLVALNDYITVADMSNVPLDNESVDIAIFCLSLMGTNFVDYLVEAHRVLKEGGILKIAELESRFVGMKKFLLLLEKLGFELEQKTQPNGYFYSFNFVKKGKCNPPKNIKPEEILKPCLYKKR